MKLKQILALTLAALLIVVGLIHGAAFAGALAFCAAATLASARSLRSGQLGVAPDTNDIATELNLTEVLDVALETFARQMMVLRAFCTTFQNVKLKGDGTVQVPYYPLQGSASKSFNGTYSFATGAGSKTDTRAVGVTQEAGGQRLYQSLSATSAEIAQYPMLDLERLGRMKGQQLAYDVIKQILSPITAANFGPAVFTGSYSGFDSDDVADIRTSCNNNRTGPTGVTDGVTTNTSTTVTSATARFTFSDIGAGITGSGIPANTTIASVNSATSVVLSAAATATATGVTFTLDRPVIPWPEIGRTLILNPDYDGALMKDSALKNAMASGSDSALKEGKFPRVFGFDYAQSAAVPANGENLVGFAAFMSALLVATAPVPPPDEANNVLDYRILPHPDLPIALEYRKWFTPGVDTLYQTIECNFGYAVGEKLALKRIVSA